LAFIPCPDVCLAVPKFEHALGEFSNTFWYYKSGFSLADQQALANAVDDIVATWFMDAMPNGITYVSTTVYDMSDETAPIVVNSDNAGAGAGIVDEMALNVALVVTHYTSGRGRSSRGRSYLAGYPEDTITDGVYAAATVTHAELYAEKLRTQPALIGWDFSVVSRYTGGSARAAGVAQAVIESSVRSAIPGTQRRRLDRP